MDSHILDYDLRHKESFDIWYVETGLHHGEFLAITVAMAFQLVKGNWAKVADRLERFVCYVICCSCDSGVII
jgi:hypothetical protein